MSRPACAAALVVAALTLCDPAPAAELSHGVAVVAGEPLARVARSGADVVAARIPPAVGRLDATLTSAERSGLTVVAWLSSPQPGLAWRSYVASTVERYGAAASGVRVRAWVVAAPTAARVRFVRRIAIGAGSPAPVLAASKRRPPSPRVEAVADGFMFDPAANTLRPLIDRVRALRRATIGRRTEIWLGPVGWSSRRVGSSPWASGLRGQRRRLATLFGLLSAKRGSWGLDGVIWSRWQDRGGARDGFGLIRRGGRAKPALRAFRRCAGQPGDTEDPPAAAPTTSIPFEVGVAPAEPPTAADYQAMRGAGVDVARFTISREIVEPVPGGAYDWSSIDREFAGLARAGIAPLPTLIDSPQLGGELSDDDALAAWGRFVTAAVERYGNGGDFWRASPLAAPPPIWQVWNEQNAPAFWRPRPSPVDYARLLDVSADAIRVADPTAQVMLGGMFGDPINVRGIDADEFLGRLYEVPGAAADFDLIAANPYAGDVAGVEQQVESLRAVAATAGDGAVPLWVTELGWSSVPDPRPQWAGYTRTAEGQAEVLNEVGDLLERNAQSWNLRGFIWYTWRDPAVSVCPFCLNAGLLGADGTAKPALAAFAALNGT